MLPSLLASLPLSLGGRRSTRVRYPLPAAFVSAATVLLTMPSARASDLPAFGTTIKPRVFILQDTSKSMLTGPQDTLGDLSAAADDYDPVNNPGGSCQNKLCQGKRAMSTVLPAYSTLAQFGLAG